MYNIKLIFSVVLLVCCSNIFANIKETNTVVNNLLVGKAEAIRGDTFKFNVSKKCKEYHQVIDCKICKELNNRDKKQLQIIDEKLKVIPKNKIRDRVKYCIECREERDKTESLLGEECEEFTKEEYIKLLDVLAPSLEKNCSEDYIETVECIKKSKEALAEIIHDKEIRCDEDQITSFVQNAKLIVVKSCKIEQSALNELMLTTGWVYLNVGANLKLQEIENEIKKTDKGIWKYYTNENDLNLKQQDSVEDFEKIIDLKFLEN